MSITNERTGIKTWAEMVRLQPKLADLAAKATLGGNARSWSMIKERLAELVGWNAELTLEQSEEYHLGSSQDYEAAYSELLSRFERAGGGF